jgi:hypothetical protein
VQQYNGTRLVWHYGLWPQYSALYLKVRDGVAVRAHVPSNLHPMTFTRWIACVAALTCAATRCHAADWMVTPMVGSTVRSQTGFVDLDETAGRSHWIYGVSVMRLSDRVLGIDGEVAIAPSFFTGHQLVQSSRVTTANVSAVLTLPRRWAAVRPYLAVGIGLVRASSRDVRNIFPIDSTLPGHLAVRADTRFARTDNVDSPSAFGGGFIEMWRVAAGVAWIR